MGDRTFSGEDVIRIYEEFLTRSEQEVVDFFFAEEQPEMSFDFLQALLETLDLLFAIFVTARFTAVVLTFGTFTSNLVNEAITLLRGTRLTLGNIIESGGVDA